jgi:hypothetical protein
LTEAGQVSEGETTEKIVLPEKGAGGDQIKENGESEYSSLSPTARDSPSTFLLSIEEEEEPDHEVSEAGASNAREKEIELKRRAFSASASGRIYDSHDETLLGTVSSSKINRKSRTITEKVHKVSGTVGLTGVKLTTTILDSEEKRNGVLTSSSTAFMDEEIRLNNNECSTNNLEDREVTRKRGVITPPDKDHILRLTDTANFAQDKLSSFKANEDKDISSLHYLPGSETSQITKSEAQSIDASESGSIDECGPKIVLSQSNANNMNTSSEIPSNTCSTLTDSESVSLIKDANKIGRFLFCMVNIFCFAALE